MLSAGRPDGDTGQFVAAAGTRRLDANASLFGGLLEEHGEPSSAPRPQLVESGS